MLTTCNKPCEHNLLTACLQTCYRLWDFCVCTPHFDCVKTRFIFKCCCLSIWINLLQYNVTVIAYKIISREPEGGGYVFASSHLLFSPTPPQLRTNPVWMKIHWSNRSNSLTHKSFVMPYGTDTIWVFFLHLDHFHYLIRWTTKRKKVDVYCYAKGKGSLTTWNDKGKIDVSSEGPSLPTPDEGPPLETSIFRLSFQVMREPLPFAVSRII